MLCAVFEGCKALILNFSLHDLCQCPLLNCMWNILAHVSHCCGIIMSKVLTAKLSFFAVFNSSTARFGSIPFDDPPKFTIQSCFYGFFLTRCSSVTYPTSCYSSSNTNYLSCLFSPGSSSWMSVELIFSLLALILLQPIELNRLFLLKATDTKWPFYRRWIKHWLAAMFVYLYVLQCMTSVWHAQKNAQ